LVARNLPTVQTEKIPPYDTIPVTDSIGLCDHEKRSILEQPLEAHLTSRLHSMCGIVAFTVLVCGALVSGQARASAAPAVQVKIGKPKVMGDLPTAEVHRVLISHRRELQACYRDAIQQDAALSGQLEVQFMIGTTGTPIWAEGTGGNLKDSPLAKCVLTQITNWRFHGGCSTGGILVKCVLGFNVRRSKAWFQRERGRGIGSPRTRF
jgi:hypothetical protein